MTIVNIFLALPGVEPENTHAMSLRETCLVLRYGLEDLGYKVVFERGLRKDCLNIVLRYQSFDGKPLPQGYKCIVYQLEQLSEDQGWCSTMQVLGTLKSAFAVWDCNIENVDFIPKIC